MEGGASFNALNFSMDYNADGSPNQGKRTIAEITDGG